MPRFPIVPQRSSAPAAFSSSPRAQAEDFGGGVGKAIADFGADAAELGQVVKKRQELAERQAERVAKRAGAATDAERLAETALEPEIPGNIAREQQRFDEKAAGLLQDYKDHPLEPQVRQKLDEQRQADTRNLVTAEAGRLAKADLARADEIAERWLDRVTQDPAQFDQATAYLLGDEGPLRGLGLRPEVQADWDAQTFDKLLSTQLANDPQRLIEDLEAGRWKDSLSEEQQATWLEDARDAAALRERNQSGEQRQRIAGEVQALQRSIAHGEAGLPQIRRAEREGRFSPQQIESLKREAEQAELRAQIYQFAQDEYALALMSGVDFDPERPQHREVAEDFYSATFREAVQAGADEATQERLADTVAKTGHVTKGLAQDLTAALLSDDPDRRVAAAQLYGRLLEAAPDLLPQSLEPEVRARGGVLNRWLDAGLPPEEALRRAEMELPSDGTVPFLDEEETAGLQRDLGSLFYAEDPARHVTPILDQLERNYLEDLGQGLAPRQARQKLRRDAGRVIAKLTFARNMLESEPAWIEGSRKEAEAEDSLFHLATAVPYPIQPPPAYGQSQVDQDLNAAAARELTREAADLSDGIAYCAREANDAINLERARLFPAYAAWLFGHAAVSIGDGKVLLGQILKEDDHSNSRLVEIMHPDHGRMVVRQQWDLGEESYYNVDITFWDPQSKREVTEGFPNSRFFVRSGGDADELSVESAGTPERSQDPEHQARVVPGAEDRSIVLPGPSPDSVPVLSPTPFPAGEGRERVPNDTGGDQVPQGKQGGLITESPVQTPKNQTEVLPELSEEQRRLMNEPQASVPVDRDKLPPGLRNLEFKAANSDKNPPVLSTPGHAWTPTDQLSESENMTYHYGEHSGDFPDVTTIWEYVRKTHEFINEPPDGVLAKIRENGDILLYHEETNTFAIRDVNGVPRTMFKPEPRIRYWNSQ